MGCPVQVGDVVRLKSGGPAMTAFKLEGSRVHCQWFDAKGQLLSHAFEKATVEPAPPDARRYWFEGVKAAEQEG